MHFRQPALYRLPSITVATVATVVSLTMLLPVFYLLLRVLGDFGDAVDIMTGQRALDAVRRTVVLAAATSLGAVVIAVPIAWLTARTDLPFARAWFVVLSLPLAVPSYVSALTLLLFLGPRGMLQDWLEPLGVDRLPGIYGFSGAWLALTLFTYPYVLLPVRTALQAMDPALEDASRSLGKSRLATTVRVTLPQLRPAIAAGAILVGLYTLSDFGAVSLVNYPSLSQQVYIQYRGTFDREAAAALALLLVFVAVAVISLDALTRGRGRYHATSTARRPRPFALGRWKWAATAALALFAAIVVGIPSLVLVWQIWVAIDNGETLQSVAGPMRNSLVVSAIGAAATLAAALPIAWFAARQPGRLAALLERAAYSGYALPGIVVALALVFFGANYVPALYQTMPLLVFAYIVRFLPEALGATRASLLRINPRTEEAGRSLGQGGTAVFLRVTLPQLLPGMSAAGTLVFLTIMKELPTTLLLSPIGFDTLATEVWSLTAEAYFARASFAATILVLLSAIPVAVLALREKTVL